MAAGGEKSLEVTTVAASGWLIRLSVERDRHGVSQVYARFTLPEAREKTCALCHGWGRRVVNGMLREGILITGMLLEVPRKDWLAVVACREDERDRDNLSHIALVPVFCRGDRVTLDGYALNARVDRATWKRIVPFMREVDSTVNEVILEGDHFVGWIVHEGREEEVERLLGVKAEKRLAARLSGGDGKRDASDGEQ